MTSAKPPKPSKRLDLQGIRGLAILAVLGFHFYPDYFPNGYLGVDQFFVLSGFLMCMLLKRSENEAPCTLISLFYSKRFKRILPLYLILIFISMIALYSFFPDTAIETNQKSAVQALMFVSNRPQTEEEDYFKMLSTAIDVFTHTWSLSVEIQFYFLVPLLFLLGARFSDQKFQYAYYSIISLISFIFFFMSPDTVAFNSVFARIWQFLIGMMVYMANGRNKLPDYQLIDCESAEKNAILDNSSGQNTMEDYHPLLQNHPEATDSTTTSTESLENSSFLIKSFSILLLIFLISLTAYSSVLPANFLRPMVTFGTGCLMLISEGNTILSNRVLTYIGDISYSLYLIHWPIYAYWKLTCDGDQKLLLLALVSSIILAIVCFETFEKWYLTLSSTNIWILCASLFLLNIIVIEKDYMKDLLDGSSSDNMALRIENATVMNHQWSVNDISNLFAPTCRYENKDAVFGWCNHTGLSPSGKYKLAIIGNSMTANHANLFYQKCGYKAKSIIQGSVIACEVLYPSHLAKSRMCWEKFQEFEERIRLEKPDYAFILTRYISTGDPFPPNITTFDRDPMYQTMKNQMQKLLTHIKYKLFILDALPGLNLEVVEKIAPIMESGKDPVDIDKLLVSPQWEEYSMVRRRHAQLVKDCDGKCELIDYTPEFYNKTTGTFRYFDENGYSFWTTSQHFSPRGLEHLRHFWTDVCRKL